MDDNARGMASKILCDLLNIPKGGSSVATDGTYVSLNVARFIKHSSFYLLTKEIFSQETVNV